MTTIKNVTEVGNKTFKSLIRFHCANKINNHNGEAGGEKKRKIQKNL